MATLSSPTLQKLITNVRTQLNQPNPNNSFWKDEELTEYLNEGVRIYFLDVVAASEGLFTTTADLNIASGTETVALPSDFFQIKNLYKKVSGGFELCSYRNNLTEGYSTQGGTGADTFIPHYYLRGNNIVLRPTPNFSETAGLKLEYVQFPETMVNGGDSLTAQVSPLFKQVIEAYAVWRAKTKEALVHGNNVASAAEGYLSGVVQTFRNSVQPRSKNPTAIIPFNPEG